MKIETSCLHAGYKPENGGPGALPIITSTTYRFDSTAHIAGLFDMPTGFILPFRQPDPATRSKKKIQSWRAASARC